MVIIQPIIPFPIKDNFRDSESFTTKKGLGNLLSLLVSASISLSFHSSFLKGRFDYEQHLFSVGRIKLNSLG